MLPFAFDILEGRQFLSGNAPLTQTVDREIPWNNSLRFSDPADPAFIAKMSDPGSSAAMDFSTAYSDPEGDSLQSIRIQSLPAGALYLTVDSITTLIRAGQIIPADKISSISYVALPNWTGPDSFFWTAYDGTSSSISHFAIVGVNGPVANQFFLDLDVNSTVTFIQKDLSQVYKGLPAFQSIMILSLPTSGTLSLTIDGATSPIVANEVIATSQIDGLTYSPVKDFVGYDSFAWTGTCDGVNYLAQGTMARFHYQIPPPPAGPPSYTQRFFQPLSGRPSPFLFSRRVHIAGSGRRGSIAIHHDSCAACQWQFDAHVQWPIVAGFCQSSHTR